MSTGYKVKNSSNIVLYVYTAIYNSGTLSNYNLVQTLNPSETGTDILHNTSDTWNALMLAVPTDTVSRITDGDFETEGTLTCSVNNDSFGSSYSNVGTTSSVVGNNTFIRVYTNATGFTNFGLRQDHIRYFDLKGTVPESPKTEIYITEDPVTNCTYKLTPDPAYVGDTLNFTFTANTGYYFKTAPYITADVSSSGYTNYNAKIGTDGTTATLTIDSGSFNSGDVYVTATAEIKPVEPTKEQITFTNTELTACHYTVTPDPAYVGDSVTVTFSADNGYYFETAPIVSGITTESGDYTDYTSVISSDTLTASITIDTTLLKSRDLQITAKAILKSDVPTVSYSFVNGYTITDDNLKELAVKRFTGGSSPTEVYDLGIYVNSLKRFYVPVPESIETDIVLGSFDTGVKGHLIAQDNVTIDCGNVTIDGITHDSNDYDNVDISVFLPFVGEESLSNNKIMDRTINIQYKVSLISGDCVASLLTDGITIYQFTGNVSEPLPYILNNVDFQLKGALNPTNNTLYGNEIVFLLISHDNFNANNSVLIDVNKYVQLSELTGLCTVSDVFLDDMTITDEEKERIREQLEDGVIF